MKINSYVALLFAFLILPNLVWAGPIDYANKVYSCTKVKLFGCQESAPPIIRNMMNLCEIEKKALGCDQLEAEEPELKDQIARCDQRSVCAEDVDPGAKHIMGCLEGLPEGAYDGLKDLVYDMPKSAYEYVQEENKQIAEYRNWETSCEKDLACKRNMAHRTKTFGKYSDEALKDVRVQYLWSMWAESVRSEGFELGRFDTPDKWEKSEKKKSSKISMAALYGMAKQELDKLNVKLDCFDDENQARLLCYGVGQALGYGGIGKVVLKTPAMINYVAKGVKTVRAAGVTGAVDAVGTVANKVSRVVKAYASRPEPFVFKEKLKVSSESASEAAEQVRRRERTGAVADRKSGNIEAARNELKSKFISDYADPIIPYTSVPQNKKWIQIAAESKTSDKFKFFEIENAEMKLANDTIGDKNLVTALTNLHKEMVFAHVEKLKASNPGLIVDPYSDFKSCRLALSGKIPDDIESQLNKLYKNVDNEFLNKEFSGVKVDDLISKDVHPNTWFRAGFGSTADEASLASRASRSTAPGSGMSSFSDDFVHSKMVDAFKQTKRMGAEVERRLGKSPLMGPSSFNPKVKSLNADVYDVIKKQVSNENIRKVIEKRYGYSMGDADIDAVRNLQHAADVYSPGIHIPERVNASLHDASLGGFTADFAGMGSQNTKGTIDALLGSSDNMEAITLARQNEKVVTELFNQKKLDFETKVNESLATTQKKPPKITCSGDDGAVCTAEILGNREIENVMGQMASAERPSDMRMAFVDPTVPNALKNRMALAGELTEKNLRKELAKVLPAEKLDATVFGVAVDASGPRLYQGMKQGVSYTPAEEALIEKAFLNAAKKTQDELTK